MDCYYWIARRGQVCLALSTVSSVCLQHIKSTELCPSSLLWVIDLCSLDDDSVGGQVDTPRKSWGWNKDLDVSISKQIFYQGSVHPKIKLKSIFYYLLQDLIKDNGPWPDYQTCMLTRHSKVKVGSKYSDHSKIGHPNTAAMTAGHQLYDHSISGSEFELCFEFHTGIKQHRAIWNKWPSRLLENRSGSRAMAWKQTVRD